MGDLSDTSIFMFQPKLTNGESDVANLGQPLLLDLSFEVEYESSEGFTDELPRRRGKLLALVEYKFKNLIAVDIGSLDELYQVIQLLVISDGAGVSGSPEPVALTAPAGFSAWKLTGQHMQKIEGEGSGFYSLQLRYVSESATWQDNPSEPE
jgi:hypothetical protein